MTRFSKVFQLLTVILVIAIANVYVLGAPVRSTDPKKPDAPETTETKADVAGAEIATTAAPVAVAAEKLPLAPNAKIDFNRIFAKSEIRAHSAASHTFFNAKVSGRDVFKSPPRTGNPPQNNGGDTDGSNATWATVGVIAAVLSVVVMVLRTRRENRN